MISDIYKNIRIIELSTMVSAPIAGKMFSDLAAKITKIESPRVKDPSGSFGYILDETSTYYETFNRDKHVQYLDLKNNTDRNIFFSLLGNTDILLTNYSSGALERLGLKYNELKHLFPRLIYAQISGYGADSKKKAYDVVIQGESGLSSLSGSGTSPGKIGPAVVDTHTGLNAAFAISSALYHRIATGKGLFLDVSMYTSALQLTESALPDTSVSNTLPSADPQHDATIFPFGLYECKDARISLAICTNAQRSLLWQRISPESVERYESAQSRQEHRVFLLGVLKNHFTAYTQTSVLEKCADLGIPVGPVCDMFQVIDNEKIYPGSIDRRSIGKQEVKFPGVPTKYCV